LPETIKEISGLEVCAEKLFSQSRGFKVMCEISCIIEREGTFVSEDIKELSVSGIMCHNYVMWNIHFLFSVKADRIYGTQFKDDVYGSLQQC
jgi:hypothetical protein